jgi:AraC family ethanolamine operon transcriptional activator
VRQRAVERVRAYVDAYPNDPSSVADLCGAARVSQRTLQYAFLENVGVTPKAYLQAIRLNGVRRELRRSGPTAKVADIANRWGFWHMGQFAADYRKLYAELPSDTLGRSGKLQFAASV